MAAGEGKYRLAVDIGGTFTDVVLARGGNRISTKVLTTHDDPGAGFLAGVEKVMASANVTPEKIGLIIHGTTLATNALIERRGAKTALLTTEGHRDALEMAYENRFEQYDVNIDRPTPLVPRYLRIPIRERMNKDGAILRPLDEAYVRSAIKVIKENDIESVAVGFLHAYANPAHELRVEEILKNELPELSVTLASLVCPEIREYERLSTACANAYVRPLMERYLNKLETSLAEREFDCPFLVMTSGGGLTTLDTAAKFPIRLVESGPAGGAILAKTVARECDLDAVVSFDMGGTTAKLCLIDNFEPLTSRTFEVDRVYRFKKGSGLPVRIPVIEMVEIGAGGGSLASVDKLKRIQVGPESAGSEPGPAAYDRGGERPAVTDSDILLGKIVPEYFAGGEFVLNIEKADKAMMRAVGEPLGLTSAVAAFGVSEVVDENMAAAARAHAVEWGKDIRSRSMVAFGGAAPLHAARLGEKLSIDKIIVPTGAGVGSAIGFLLAPIAYEVVRSRHMSLVDFDAAVANAIMAQMHEEASAVVRQGAPDAPLVEMRQAFMRYQGQGHEIAVDLPLKNLSIDDAATIRDEFNTAYERLYGRTIPGVAIEILSWTLTLKTASEESIKAKTESVAIVPAPLPVKVQKFFDPALAQNIDASVFLRDALSPGMVIDGPALITEDQTTTVVTSSYTAEVNSLGYIVMTMKGEA
ncbi:MAG: methylhydantoinase [Hyphococcus sp.]|nr:MAG: methylhydantoinase [Marinicaulis sp.]